MAQQLIPFNERLGYRPTINKGSCRYCHRVGMKKRGEDYFCSFCKSRKENQERILGLIKKQKKDGSVKIS